MCAQTKNVIFSFFKQLPIGAFIRLCKDCIVRDVSFCKTIRINFTYFDFITAIKFPILVSRRAYLKTVKGHASIESEIKYGLIIIGGGDGAFFDIDSERTVWLVDGNVVFKGRALFGYGSRICVHGSLILGEDFCMVARSSILCKKKISFGNHCLISWDVLIMDTDAHKIMDSNDHILNEDREVCFGDHVWIGCNVLALKGIRIGNNCTVGADALLTDSFEESGLLIAGKPARIIRKNIHWAP